MAFSSPARRIAGPVLAVALGAVAATPARPAAGAPEADTPWTFLARGVISGNSSESEPAGLEILSGVSIEAALRREFGGRWAAELSLRTESREVDYVPAGGGATQPVGSLETLPVMLLAQYRPPLGGRWHPYLGAGAAFTVVWEKSGAFDSHDVTPTIGPALQLGTDVDLGPRGRLNFDIRWNAWTADIRLEEVTMFDVTVDPLSLGAGVGFRF